ncbi:MAG: DUF1318 domain-containing protein [Nitrospiraceae bacterium]|nr:DUF1318 domain-containing protein [Nitrospiraceae bacterium]
MSFLHRITSCILCALLLAAVGGCAITAPFLHLKPDYTDLPADALRAVAEEIEAAVQRGDREPEIADRDGVAVSSERVKQAIRMRAARAEILNDFRDTGYARESRNGLIKLLHSKEYKQNTTKRDRDRYAMVVYNENNDRWAIYEGIVEDSNYASRVLPAVQETFFAARLEHLRDGQKYEDESGALAVKGR